MKVDLLIEKEITTPLADMCRCANCGWQGKCSECETEYESDGWENPEYQIHICPICDENEGCIGDYWFSDELIEEMEKLKNKLTTK